MLVKRIKNTDSVDMETLTVTLYKFARQAFSQLCLHPSWKVKREDVDVVVTDDEKSLMYDIWEECFSTPLDGVQFTAILVGCYSVDVFNKAFEADSSHDATLRHMKDFGEYIANTAPPDFVSIFTLFVENFSLSSRHNAGRFLKSGYMPLVCRIANVMMRPAYLVQWHACVELRANEDHLQNYWKMLDRLYLIVECLVDVDSKEVFTEHGQDVARLLSTFADLERAEVKPSEALLRSARSLALRMRSSAEYYSVIRAMRPQLIRVADAQVLSEGGTRPFGQLLLSVRQAIEMRRRWRPEFVNTSHPMCAFETVGFSDHLPFFDFLMLSAQCEISIPLKQYKKCSGCREVKYCSRRCQKADWSRHKLNCWQDQEGTLIFRPLHTHLMRSPSFIAAQ
jgi:hypothetical protein